MSIFNLFKSINLLLIIFFKISFVIGKHLVFCFKKSFFLAFDKKCYIRYVKSLKAEMTVNMI